MAKLQIDLLIKGGELTINNHTEDEGEEVTWYVAKRIMEDFLNSHKDALEDHAPYSKVKISLEFDV